MALVITFWFIYFLSFAFLTMSPSFQSASTFFLLCIHLSSLLSSFSFSGVTAPPPKKVRLSSMALHSQPWLWYSSHPSLLMTLINSSQTELTQDFYKACFILRGHPSGMSVVAFCSIPPGVGSLVVDSEYLIKKNQYF